MLKHKESATGIYPIKQNNDQVIKPICKVSIDRKLIRPIDGFDLNPLCALVRDDHHIPSLLRFTVSQISLNIPF